MQQLPEGTSVALVRDPSRRGVVIDAVSTWRCVKWVGRGASNHRPYELTPVVLSAAETADASAPLDCVLMLQQLLDEELVVETADGRRIGNILANRGPQLVASREDGEWRVECTVCRMRNILPDGAKHRTSRTDVRDIAAHAKRHVGAWRSLVSHKPARHHWARLSELLGETLVPATKRKHDNDDDVKRPTVQTWGRCSLCDRDRALVVSLCGDPAHALCEPHAREQYGNHSIAEMLEDPSSDKFRCRACRDDDVWIFKCWVCGRPHESRAVLLCAHCPRAFHISCLGPGASDDATDWRCAACERRGRKGPDAASVLAFDAVKAKLAPYRQVLRSGVASPRVATAAAKATLAALRRHDFAKHVPLPAPDPSKTAVDIVADIRAAFDRHRAPDAPDKSVACRRMVDELAALADKCFDAFVFPRTPDKTRARHRPTQSIVIGDDPPAPLPPDNASS